MDDISFIIDLPLDIVDIISQYAFNYTTSTSEMDRYYNMFKILRERKTCAFYSTIKGNNCTKEYNVLSIIIDHLTKVLPNTYAINHKWYENACVLMCNYKSIIQFNHDIDSEYDETQLINRVKLYEELLYDIFFMCDIECIELMAECYGHRPEYFGKLLTRALEGIDVETIIILITKMINGRVYAYAEFIHTFFVDYHKYTNGVYTIERFEKLHLRFVERVSKAEMQFNINFDFDMLLAKYFQTMEHDLLYLFRDNGISTHHILNIFENGKFRLCINEHFCNEDDFSEVFIYYYFSNTVNDNNIQTITNIESDTIHNDKHYTLYNILHDIFDKVKRGICDSVDTIKIANCTIRLHDTPLTDGRLMCPQMLLNASDMFGADNRLWIM